MIRIFYYNVQVQIHIRFSISGFRYHLSYSSLSDSHVFMDASHFYRTTSAP